ncbi:MAG TPA: outer membrane lipoprotein chaperone LolA [Burkholderiales bacterium]
MKGLRFLLLLGVLWAFDAAAQPPGGRESLERFFEEVERYTAQFNQVVVDETGETIQESNGRLWIERPNKFRWNYETPYKQQIVSDGERLWVYDEDLKQVTVRPLKKGLLETPAALLAGRGRLAQRFDIRDGGAAEGLAWVELTPKEKDGSFERVRLGFEQGRLRKFELQDALGQTTRYTLRGGVENQPIAPSRFTFTPPPGVDVVGEP